MSNHENFQDISNEKNQDGVIETDGTFFTEMFQMERDILKRKGDTEALAFLEEEARKAQAEYEEELASEEE